MWFWQKNKRRDLLTREILKGLKNLDMRLRELERAHNETAEAIDKLGSQRHGITWNTKDREWKREAV